MEGQRVSSHVGFESYFITLDDDPSVAVLLEAALSLPTVRFSAAETLEAVAEDFRPLAAFIDIELEGGRSGLDIIPNLRAAWPYCPIIVVTSHQEDSYVEEAFRRGADDLVIKPLRPLEVRARFQTRLTDLQERAHGTTMSVGDISLDTKHRVVSGPLGRHFLAPVETHMLAKLIQARGTVLPKEVLKLEGWGPIRVSDNAFYRKLFELRKGLQSVTQEVRVNSIYGCGISLEVLPAAQSVPPGLQGPT